MHKLGQAAVKELYKDLAYKFEIPFEEKCFEILISLFTTIEKVPPRGDLDSSGIDLFGWNLKNQTIDKYFQCKGFQVKEYGESQYSQCAKSIQSFIESDKNTEIYYLIVNRPISLEFQKKLEIELKKIVNVGKAKIAQLLDLYKFIDFIYEKQVEIIKEDIKRTFRFYYGEYTSSMNQCFYYDNVPFVIGENIKKNPLKHVLKRSNIGLTEEQTHSVDFVKSKYFFIISEFGYGKTSLMLQLFMGLVKNKFIPIYLPAAVFSSDGFSNPANLCRDILNLINSTKIEGFQVYNNFKNRVLKNILDNSPEIVLLLDGLDEHKFLKKDTNLKMFFNCFREIKAIPVFSLRKEFWEERFGNITMAIGKNRKIQDKIILTEWSNDDILSFINLFLEQRKKIDKNQMANLLSLKEIVIKNEYANYYGDIPKRPLFLEMIITDVINDNIKTRNLSELYENYFKQKLYRDRTGQFQSFSPSRDIPYEMDIMKLYSIILKILEDCASKMFTLEDGKIILTNSIQSTNIEHGFSQNNFKDILDLLLHSVLVTAEERHSDDLKLKFAHFSFLEYFFARYVAKDIDKNNN